MKLEDRAGGEGFVQDFSFSLVAGAGVVAFGSQQAHDVAWGTLGYGWMLCRPLAEGHWYAGQFEFRLEFFAGAQFSPEDEWIVGLTPHLRYNFQTGTRLVPFVDAGAGVTATGIGPPDLSNTFEFNLQMGAGLHWFLKDNLALTFEARFLHLSCAGLSQPNLGLNAMLGSIGVTTFF